MNNTEYDNIEVYALLLSAACINAGTLIDSDEFGRNTLDSAEQESFRFLDIITNHFIKDGTLDSKLIEESKDNVIDYIKSFYQEARSNNQTNLYLH